MATDSITASTSSSTNPLSNLTAQSRTPTTTLSQDDFLKLLVTQMTTQDPMKPMEDLSSFSQLASFSALEQNKATAASMSMIQANSMIGDYVTVSDPNGNPLVGQVSQVQMLNGVPQIIVGGQRYSLDQVTAVSTAPYTLDSSTQASTTSATSSTTPLPVTPDIGLPPALGVTTTTGTAPTLNVPAILGSAVSL